VLTACGADTGGAGTPTPSPTPLPPASGHLTSTGDVALVTTVAPAAITCSYPSLNGLEILLFVQNVDKSLGGFVTLSSSQGFVRIGAGSGATYTQRNFVGMGVTNFDAAKGAQFNAQLADNSPSGQNKGTIGAVNSIAGSVTCRNKNPGSGNITITGDSTGGAIHGALTSLLVSCSATMPNFARISALMHACSAPDAIEFGGGGTEITFASISTSSTSFFFGSSTPGLYTVTNGHVHWNNKAVLTQSGAGAAGHEVTISGDATCGI
jgi:hypothetical protein